MYRLKQIGCVFIVISVTFILGLKNVFAIKRVQLEAHLTKQIEAILDTSQLLHQSLTRNESDKTEAHLTYMKNLVTSARQASYQTSTNTLHLRHILNNTERALEEIGLYSQERQKQQQIKSVFHQIVLLSQTYQLDSKYPVYFCTQDKSVWLQKMGKIRNPIHPHYTRCGAIVH